VVGGYAAVAHGGTLVTQDLDVCCDLSADNLLRIQEALKDVHSVHRMTPKRLPLRLTKDNCRGLKNIYLDTDIGQLDCLGEILGIGDFQAVQKRSMVVDTDGCQLRLLELDALIQAKKALNRPRDQEAVLQLQAIREREK
jgi:hypothetical protein